LRQSDGTLTETASALKCALAEEVLRSFGPVRFPAIGRSMVPAVWPGDTLVVERVSPDQVGIGDVVVAARHGGLCAHRVIAVSSDAAPVSYTHLTLPTICSV